MIGKFVVWLFLFLKKRVYLQFIFLSILSGFCFFGIQRIQLNKNIYSILPKGEEFKKLDDFISSGKFSNQLVFAIPVDSSFSNDSVKSIQNKFETHLKSLNDVDKLLSKTSSNNTQSDVYEFCYRNFPLFIDSSYYEHLDSVANSKRIKQQLVKAKQIIASPSGFFLHSFLMNDPIGMTVPFFEMLNKNLNINDLIIEDDLIYSKNKSLVFIFYSTKFNIKETDKCIQLYSLLKKNVQTFNKNNNLNINYFGSFQIAAENAIQIEKDIKITVSIAIFLILLILLIFYKSVWLPIVFMLPSVLSFLTTLATIGWFYNDISVISLSISAVLFGIMVDFSFHFYTHLKHSMSIEQTLKEISFPLVVGSFTTILAFFSLLFANSTILNQFGLVSTISILLAVVFTLVFLPQISVFKLFKNNDLEINKHSEIKSKKPKFLVTFIIIITTSIVMYNFAFDIEFDGNIESLNLHSNKLKENEKQLLSIHPDSVTLVYLFANDEDTYKRHLQKLKNLKNNGFIDKYVNASSYINNNQLIREKNDLWKKFLKLNAEKLLQTFENVSDSLGFSKSAFSDFKSLISDTSNRNYSADSVQKILNISSLVLNINNSKQYVSIVKLKKENISTVKQAFSKIDNTTFFYKKDIANELLKQVQSDFNYLLIVSSSAVFVVLLLVYGRIELALLTFFPMLLAWIWILGFSTILGIKFNFVNVIVSTIIFGLGDDFSVFVTDGLLKKYISKNNSLQSYSKAIFLSAFTTIVGTGVLFLAVHPSMQSIAAISVLGLMCILFFSLYIQPFIFNFFIQSRIEKKKKPVSIFSFLLSLFEFPYFLFGCLFVHILLLFIRVLPIKLIQKRKMLNFFISKFAKSVIYSGFHVKKRILNIENLDISKPSILISNHTSFLDILLTILLNPGIIIMVKDWVYNSPIFGYFIRYAGYVYSTDGAEMNIDIVKQRMSEGYSIMIFPEGTRGLNDSMSRFHKGAFYLAEQLKVDITPIIFHGAHYVLPKNDYMVKSGVLTTVVLPRIVHNNEKWGIGYRERSKNISKYYKEQYFKWKNELEDTEYLWYLLFDNYIYKGPIVEWYIRIKWMLEKENYQFYDQLIENRNQILDVGCGYGYLSLYLKLRNPNRVICGVDYDDDKVQIAKSQFLFDDGLTFKNIDILENDFENKDVVLLCDVLHYMSKEKQLKLLNKCYDNLNNNGLIIIRDGFSDSHAQHKNTALTEFLSTKVFNFNKKTENFTFFNSKFIYDFADKNNMQIVCEMNHSTKTSNKLIVLKRTNENTYQ